MNKRNIYRGAVGMAMEKQARHYWHKIQHSEALGPKFLAAMQLQSNYINIYEDRDQNTGQGGAI